MLKDNNRCFQRTHGNKPRAFAAHSIKQEFETPGIRIYS